MAEDDGEMLIAAAGGGNDEDCSSMSMTLSPDETFVNLSDLQRIETKLNLLCAAMQETNRMLSGISSFRRSSKGKKRNEIETDDEKTEVKSRLSAAKKMEDKVIEVLRNSGEDNRLNKKPLRKEVANAMSVNVNSDYFRKKFNKAIKQLLLMGVIGFHEKHQLYFVIE